LNRRIDVENGTLIGHLQRVETPFLEALQKEFYFLESFDYEELKERARRRSDLPKNLLDPTSYPAFVHAYLTRSGDRSYLELANPLPYEVEVQSINWRDKVGHHYPFQPRELIEYPLLLSPTAENTLPSTLHIDFTPSANEVQNTLLVKSNIKGYDITHLDEAVPYPPP